MVNMKALLTLLTVAFFATVHAQPEPLQKHALPTEWDISIKGPVSDTFPNATHAESKNPYTVTAEMSLPVTICWGIDDTPILTTDDRVALRLYQSENLKWYDFKAYKFKGHGKRAVWIGYAVAGVFHGGREAYHAEPNVFEKRFGVGKTSWFGSEQWRRNYHDLDPTQKHKPDAFNTFRDYYHFSNTLHTGILIGGALTIGASEQPVKYRLFDTLIAITVRSAAASLTYNILR